MEIVIRTFEGCPHADLAETRIREALGDASVHREMVVDPEDAQRLEFRGSPTILVDGRDLFGDPADPVGLSCRLYRTEDGLDGSPSVAQLREVLG